LKDFEFKILNDKLFSIINVNILVYASFSSNSVIVLFRIRFPLSGLIILKKSGLVVFIIFGEVVFFCRFFSLSLL